MASEEVTEKKRDSRGRDRERERGKERERERENSSEIITLVPF